MHPVAEFVKKEVIRVGSGEYSVGVQAGHPLRNLIGSAGHVGMAAVHFNRVVTSQVVHDGARHRESVRSPHEHLARQRNPPPGEVAEAGGQILRQRLGVTETGIARAALDNAVALTASKAPNGFTTLLADKGVVQDKLARAQALLSAGRDTVYVQAGKAWDYAQSGQSISPVEGLPLGLAGTFAVQAAIQVVDIVQDVAGTTGIRRSQDFQRYFRDVHTLAQHALANSSRFESLGKLMLGRESDFGFYYV